MRIASVKGVELRVHPLLIVVLAAACVLGRLVDFLQSALALLLHEGAHVLIALAFNTELLSVEFLPFGGVARVREHNLMPYSELCVAAAGPVTSFIIAGVAAALFYVLPRAADGAEAFLRYNLILALINLLPALPLDGGRILKCVLVQFLPLGRAVRIAALSGIVLGTGLLAATVICAHRQVFTPVLPMMGVFLLLGAASELRRRPERELTAFMKKNDGMRAGANYPVHYFAAHGSMTAAEALKLMRHNRYNLLRVVGDGMETLGELDEGALLVGLARGGARTTLSNLLEI